MSKPPNRTIPGPPYCPACINPESVTAPLFETGGKLAQPPKAHVYLNSECHPYSGLLAEFCQEHFTLTLVCRMCSHTWACFVINPTVTFPMENF